MPDMSYSPINPQTGKPYTAQRQVGFGVQWYDQQPDAQQSTQSTQSAQSASPQIGAYSPSTYKPSDINLPAQASGGNYQPNPLNLPAQATGGQFKPQDVNLPSMNLPGMPGAGSFGQAPGAVNLPGQVTGGGDNPFMGQMKDAQDSMNAYLRRSGPSLSQQNAFADSLAKSQSRLSSLMDDPNSIQQSAAYKFRVGQGQEALQRQMAAKGMLGSGNRLMELTKYGQDMGSQEYDAQAKRLQDQLGLQSQGYGNERQANLGQYQADVGAHTARGQTLANLMGTATSAASSAYGQGLQSATTQRGQDVSALLQGRGQDVDMYNQRMQAAMTGRGQDISAQLQGRGQDVDWQQAQLQAATTGRGQDLSALIQGRGQDIGWQEAQMQNATTGRGQDLSALIQGRGQDIGWQESMMNAGLIGRGQDVTQRGQDLSYQSAMSKLQDSQNTWGGNVTTRGGFSTRGY